MNDYQFKLARIDGDFIWHDHADTDEAFVVPRGDAANRLRGWSGAPPAAGEMFVVPKGTKHKPCAVKEKLSCS